MTFEAIAPEAVPVVFNDECIQQLAGYLPLGADIECFAERLRDAALEYARDARVPSANELHYEIEALHAAVENELTAVYGQADRRRRRQKPITLLYRKLSSEALGMLLKRGDLPPLIDLLDPERRANALETIRARCSYGAEWIEGRKRPNRPVGKRERSRTLRPLICAPEPSRHFVKRYAERSFVIGIRLAWLHATGEPPARTAQFPTDGVRATPFVNLVDQCLRLVGASGQTRRVNAVELINELARRREKMTH